MATISLLVLIDILYDPTVDIKDPDTWTTLLITH